MTKVGVLAIQGDFAAHLRMLKRMGVEGIEIRHANILGDADGLIIPGGESTTMLKVLTQEGLLEPIKDFAKSGKPIFGTCAGAILLAQEVTQPYQESLGLIEMTVERNAYGRQVDSQICNVETCLEGGKMEAVFIRAPRITKIGENVAVLATLSGEPVFVHSANIFAATFHPELTNDERAHRLFVSSLSKAHTE